MLFRRSETGRRPGVWAGVLCLLALISPSFAWDTNDWEFLDAMETTSLRFFQNEKSGPYDLIADHANYTGGGSADVTSVAGVGFELTAICLGHYRGWISFSNAYEQVLQQMQAFNNLLSSDPEVLKRENGWTYHWYNLATGYAQSPDGLSLLDHSLFIAGCIFVAEYFKGTEAGELAMDLYEETTWSWRPDGDYNFGYSENLLAVIESAEAPTWKKGYDAYVMWNSYNVPWPRALQLYFWQYPHCWIDFRFRVDDRGYNHADIARDSILYQRQRAMDMHGYDPARYDMIGSNVWGWTAASGSEGYRQMAPWGMWLHGEWLSEERASDSGSITPFALPPCMIYAPTETMAAMKHIYEEYYVNGWDPGAGEMPVWSDMYGFLNCFNAGQPWNTADSNLWWGVNAAIDYGPNVLMLENYKLGTTWRYFMQNTSIDAGMYTVGFDDAWNVTAATFSNGVNQFGGGIGHWENAGVTATSEMVTVSDVDEFVGNQAVRFTTDGPTAGGWIDLNGWDQRGQALLTFWIRGLTGAEAVAIGLKDGQGNENKVSLHDYTGNPTPTNWTQVKIPLETFCLTGSSSNDTWLGDLNLVSFAFTNPAGGTLDIDCLAFTRDTLAPQTPSNDFGVAAIGSHARVRWDPAVAERDVVGYHVWRRHDNTGAFERVTRTLVPAYLGAYDDTDQTLGPGQPIRYAIQAFDNSEPANYSAFTLEKEVFGGQMDLDWNNGRNPNVLGGRSDGYYGPAAPQEFVFVYTNGPRGANCWVRRSQVTAAASGHFIDLADGDAGDYAALGFSIRGVLGGEQLLIGLRDANDDEVIVDLDDYLPGGVTTSWSRVVLPFTEFTNVDVTALRYMSITHEAAGEVLLAQIGFELGQRSALIEDHYTEAEHFTRQAGSSTHDYKEAASGGEVLGWGWGWQGGDYADYELSVTRTFKMPTLHMRYACYAGDGRTLDVQWNGALQGYVVCTNTGGWGEQSNHFSWAAVALPTVSAGYHKVTFFADGIDEPVNLDYWYLSDAQSGFRECEDYLTQVGSSTQDLKAGASEGEVLGMGWGGSPLSEVTYQGVDAGTQTNAWFHLWYALMAPTGCTVDVYIDTVLKARVACVPTHGWGERAHHFDRASASVGPLTAGPHTVRLATPAGGQSVNLDCLYVGQEGPEGLARDGDGDGISDRQEDVLGTAPGTADSDGDGISDGDEMQYGAFQQVSDPASSDTDSDGHDDGEEWTAGTDPNDADSVFQWLEISDVDFPMVGKVFRWPSATGRIYSISTSSNLLTSDSWPLISGLPATPPENTWTDTISGADAQMLYRIDVKRAP